MSVIKDGTGTGILAKVDDSNRLQTTSTTQSGFRSAQKKGDAFILSTGVITLTTDNESAIIYLKSLEESDLVIENVSIRLGSSTGGAAIDLIRTDYIQPTTGSLITDAVPALVANLLTSNTTTLNADVFQGSEGKELGGEIVSDDTLQLTGQIKDEAAGFIVPKGTALGLSIKPPSGNTMLKVQILIVVYLLDSE